MNNLIVSALNGLIVVLLFEYLFIRHLRKELKDVKKKNEDDLREVFQLRGENACLREEVECLERGGEVELQKLREENRSLTLRNRKVKDTLDLIMVVLEALDKAHKKQDEEMQKLRQQNEALHKELLEQDERQKHDKQ